LPDTIDDYIDNPVRFIDRFIDGLDVFLVRTCGRFAG
jgi:hypothetical protein